MDVPYRTYGVNLSSRSDNVAALTLSMDTSGNLLFKDDYVTNILDKPNGITLKELYTRTKGVYSNSNGELIFNDSTLSRPYTLSEIVDSSSSWKNNLLTGALWWMGNVQTNHSPCANIPRKPESTSDNLRLWSIDRFFFNKIQSNVYSRCNSDEIIFGDLFVNQLNGEWIWYDVPGLAMVLPPIIDEYKISQIIAKLAFVAYNSSEPIVFRLWDDTNNIELSRVAIVQCNPCEVSYPVTLSWQGKLETPANCTLRESCGCVDISCTTGDASCNTVESSQVVKRQYDTGSRVIKVQFHVSGYQTDHWSRIFGMEVDGEYVAQSTMEAMIFDSSPQATYGKRNATIQFKAQKTAQVTFENPLTSSNYAISLSCDQNINCWWTSKTNVGFTIVSELPFTGSIDWTITNLNATTIG
jgi:hypothetical protein